MVNIFQGIFKKIVGAPGKVIKLNEFRKFKNNIHRSTLERHQEIVDSVRIHSEGLFPRDFENPLFEIGSKLNRECLNHFHLKHDDKKWLRVLIHLPPASYSPAGFSIFMNLKASFEYMGIRCEFLHWHDEISTVLKKFRPTMFLTSDSWPYLCRINWNAIREYKKEARLEVGLTASIEAYGNSPLEARLELARKNGVDFYYSFRSPSYVESRKEYLPFRHQGFQVISIEFSANPLMYSPINGVPRDLPFVFLGSSNLDKFQRYNHWFGPIITRVGGFINGPGWGQMDSPIPLELNRYLYARAQVGLNLHLDEQIEWPCELNERAYVLAACGVPQLIDNPKLLGDRFSPKAFFSASSPSEYIELFYYILESPAEATLRSKLALEEVYAKHTTFHRVDEFVSRLKI